MQLQTLMAESRSGAADGWQARAGTAASPAPRERAPALDDLDRSGTRRTVRRGQELYAAGEPAEHCYRVVAGSVRTVELDEDGRRQIADFLLPGDLFGLESMGTHHLSAEAVTDTVVLCYPRRLVESLAEQHPALARRLRHLALEDLRRAHGKMFLLGRKTAGERIAAFLLEMAARAPAGSDAQIDLPMTRGDIADHLGLTIETVSRNMARLCRDGTIVATKCGVEIRNPRALRGHGASDARH